MGLSLKTADMNAFLHQSAGEAADFSCMLWGVIMASPSAYLLRNRTAEDIDRGFILPGDNEPLSNTFCFIGCTNDCLYMVALYSYNTSVPLARFAIPFDAIKKVSVRKAFITGTRTFEIDCTLTDIGDEDDPEETEYPAWFMVEVKNITLGTDIKDQRENADAFFRILERFQ